MCANNNTMYSCNINLQTILKDLVNNMQNILKCFKVNSMKTDLKKLQFMILGKSTRQCIIINNNNINTRELSISVV